MSRTRRRGFSDEIGSWKIICIRGRIFRSASPVERGQLGPVEPHAARDGRRELHDRPPGRRLAAARLADEPERLALDDVEADVGDRVHLQAVAPDRELDDEVARRAAAPSPSAPRRCAVPLPAIRRSVRGPARSCEPRRGGGDDRPSRLLRSSASMPSGVPTGNQQRYSCPGVAAAAAAAPPRGTGPARTGSAARTCSPVGGFTRSGGRPGIVARRVWLRSASFGIDESSASV